LETVLDVDAAGPDGPTGVHYAPQTVEALVAAVRRFERLEGRFDPARLEAWARRFSPEVFLAKFKQQLAALLALRGLGEPW
ncbi:MAG: glycosyltransferase family 4 protein, partial [Phycisphaerae bacterium]